MGELQPPDGLQDVVHRLAHRERSLISDQHPEVLPLDVFHYQVMHAARLVGVVGGDDVRVAELGGRLDLALEVDDGQPEELIRLAAVGDAAATQQLLARYRGRLRQMVVVRLDPRLAARLDPSDVVQEALVEITKRLPKYLRDRPLPIYPWLRQITWEQLRHLHVRHLAERSLPCFTCGRGRFGCATCGRWKGYGNCWATKVGRANHDRVIT